jgi:putative membrane protein
MTPFHLAGALLMLTPVVRADEDKAPTTDQQFLLRALGVDNREIAFAEHALKRTRNEEVRKLVEDILTRHIKTRETLTDRAKELKVRLPDGLLKEERERLERLARLEGQEFDREYLRYLLDEHEKAIRLYEQWAKETADPVFRDLASRALLTVKDHLDQARRLAARFKP